MPQERRHRRHAADFKMSLVNAYLKGEDSLSALAKANDISHALLRIWVDKYRAGDLKEEFERVARDQATRAKIECLTRTVLRLKREVAELKDRSSRSSSVKSRIDRAEARMA